MENIEDQVNERLISLFNEMIKKSLSATYADLGNETGVGKANIYRVVKHGGGISMAMLARIYKRYPEISLHWLLTGEGMMFCRSSQMNVVSEPEIDYGDYVKKEEYKRLEMLFKVLHEELENSREELKVLRGRSASKEVG
jgi:hypothetical protein